MPMCDVHEDFSGQLGELREQLRPTGAERVLARDRGDGRAGIDAAPRPRWLALPPGEPEPPGAPAFDAPFHAGAEDAAGAPHG